MEKPLIHTNETKSVEFALGQESNKNISIYDYYTLNGDTWKVTDIENGGEIIDCQKLKLIPKDWAEEKNLTKYQCIEPTSLATVISCSI